MLTGGEDEMIKIFIQPVFSKASIDFQIFEQRNHHLIKRTKHKTIAVFFRRYGLDLADLNPHWI